MREERAGDDACENAFPCFLAVEVRMPAVRADERSKSVSAGEDEYACGRKGVRVKRAGEDDAKEKKDDSYAGKRGVFLAFEVAHEKAKDGKWSARIDGKKSRACAEEEEKTQCGKNVLRIENSQNHAGNDMEKVAFGFELHR